MARYEKKSASLSKEKKTDDMTLIYIQNPQAQDLSNSARWSGKPPRFPIVIDTERVCPVD
jgi:hypothetical protein